jgi:pilus assembly protein CpaC
LSNTLAEPNLTAISGEQAGFLAGGEFPVPTGRDRNGNITIEYRAFGVSLNFVPTVVTDDRISLQLNTEVSSLDFNQGITISEVSVPGLDVRRASTTIEMGSGSSLMIAGLMKSEAVKNLAGVPGIKDTPVLGDLVSSHSFTREETELLVIVTPMLVQPYAENRHILRKDKAPETHQLAMTFAKNIRRIYGTKAPEMNEKGDTFGYIID